MNAGRQYLWAFVALVIAIVLAYILISLARDNPGQTAFGEVQQVQRAQGPTPPPPCIEPSVEETIRRLALLGLENAMADRTEKLFEVWMRDDAGQPGRAQVGINQAINAFVRARDLMLGWNPVPCTTIYPPPPEQKQ